MKMIKGRGFFIRLILLGALAAVGLSLISCEDVTGFFSNSWGKEFKRDYGSFEFKVDDVKDMVKTYAADQEASRVLLGKIKDAANNATGLEKGQLQSSGLAAAKNASGLGTTILEKAGDFLNEGEDDDEALDKLTKVVEDLSKNDVQGIAKDIQDLMGIPGSDGTYHNIDDNAGTDLVMGAVICLLGDYQNSGASSLEDYMDDFSDNVDHVDNGDINIDNLEPLQQTAYYLLKTAKEKSPEGILGDLLTDFNF
jgi:hypothetical protein